MKSYHDIVGDGGSNVAEQVQAQSDRLERRLENVGNIVAVMSGKGGVGKSSVTVNLAATLQAEGYRVGIVDADINGASIVQMTGVLRGPDTGSGGVQPPVTRDGVQVMSIDLFLEEGDPVEWAATTDHSAYTWRGMVEVGAIREMLTDTDWDSLDVLLIDLPPGTDKLSNLLDVLPGLTAAIVVTVPSRASQYVVRKSVLIARKALGDRPIGLIENMATFVCTSCQTTHNLFPGGDDAAWYTELQSEWNVTHLGAIPFDPDLSATTDNGQPYMPGAASDDLSGKSSGESAAKSGKSAAVEAIRQIGVQLTELLSLPLIQTPKTEDVQ